MSSKQTKHTFNNLFILCMCTVCISIEHIHKSCTYCFSTSDSRLSGCSTYTPHTHDIDDDRCVIPRDYPPVSPQGSPHGFSPKMNIYTNLSEKNIYFKILQKKIYILKFQKKITKIINNLYFIICKGGY